MSVHRLWIPTKTGSLECDNCGIHWGGETLSCGHHHCQICIGRGRDEDHECDGPPPAPFDRATTPCYGCEEIHPDWESCAKAIREFARAQGILSIVAKFVVDRSTGAVKQVSS